MKVHKIYNMNISIKENENIFVGDSDFELVERKGVGHPDTMCDAIAERASRNYSQYCIKKFGKVANHWFDKVMLIGGEADTSYGKGIVMKPYTIVFAGKVSYAVGDIEIPVNEILFQSTGEVLSEVLTGFIPEKHIVIINKLVDYQGAGRANRRYRPESIDELPELANSALVSNDCNLLSGYAPLSTLESIVLETERYINGREFKMNNPDTGWDVKLFGRRKKNDFELLVNMPFLAKDINTLEEYFSRKKEIQNQIEKFIDNNYQVNIKVSMNATDRNGKPYLTALGSVADTGDVGVVGRGNRINGLITPMRPMSIEAPAGKNPIDHTGKIYGVLAMEIADKIYKFVKHPVDVHIYTAKESSLNNPDEIIVKIYEWNRNEEELRQINQIINGLVSDVGDISRKIILQGVEMW